MASGRRLLILSCSQRKRPDPGLLPAIERYDGPAFRVLRKFMRERQDDARQLDVFIISAAYGLIPAEYPIANYDQAMTSQRAVELGKTVTVTFADLMTTGYTELCLSASTKYLAAFKGWSTLVLPGVSAMITNGPQGSKLAQLKHWLWQGKARYCVQKQQVAEPSGVAHLRGIEVRLTREQVLERARTVLSEGATEASRFREWYVEIDGERLAPKWLVSKLTGLPVSVFTACEARRFLNRLGIQVQRPVGRDTNETGSC